MLKSRAKFNGNLPKFLLFSLNNLEISSVYYNSGECYSILWLIIYRTGTTNLRPLLTNTSFTRTRHEKFLNIICYNFHIWCYNTNRIITSGRDQRHRLQHRQQSHILLCSPVIVKLFFSASFVVASRNKELYDNITMTNHEISIFYCLIVHSISSLIGSFIGFIQYQMYATKYHFYIAH